MKNNHLAVTALLTLGMLISIGSCTQYKYNNDPDSDPNIIDIGDCNLDNISFEGTILNILQDNCIDCHNSSSPIAGYDYSDYDQVTRSVADGSLMGAINAVSGYPDMPPGNQLSSCEINQISTWIKTLNLDSIPIVDSEDEISTCDPDTVYFQNTILPLVVSSCATAKCHDQISHKDGIRLTDYHSIMTTGKIKAGDPNDSEFFEVLTESGDDRMPPSPFASLNNDQINSIKTWILQGAKDNSCNEGCDLTNVTFSDVIWPMLQNNCTGCHTSSNPGGGITISNYNDVAALVSNGMLMGTVRYEAGFSPMPANKQLSDCKIDQLQVWIDDGFPQ